MLNFVWFHYLFNSKILKLCVLADGCKNIKTYTVLYRHCTCTIFGKLLRTKFVICLLESTQIVQAKWFILKYLSVLNYFLTRFTNTLSCVLQAGVSNIRLVKNIHMFTQSKFENTWLIKQFLISKFNIRWGYKTHKI